MDDDCRMLEPLDEPNFTQHPNVFYDVYMPLLSGAEWKVLSYIVRRTFGYHKETQFVEITQEMIVAGTRCSRSTVAQALKDFESHGFLEVARKVSEHGTEANSYRIRTRLSAHRTAADRKSDSVGRPPTGQPSYKENIKQKEPPTPLNKNTRGQFGECSRCSEVHCVCGTGA